MITIQSVIAKLAQKNNLTAEEMQTMMWAILSESVTPMQLGGFLTAMCMKGETMEELAAAMQVIKQVISPVAIEDDALLTITGTGGDGSHTFNISTCSAFVVAAAGGKVIKYGNHSVSSRSGGADVLAAAGINLTLTPQQIISCIEETGLGFMYAPHHHSLWRHAAGARKELGVRTFFNLIAPLVNPANVKRQLIGVFNNHWLFPVAQILKQAGSRRALIVHSEDGLDEISIDAPTQVAELKNDQIIAYQITPEQFGLSRASLENIKVNNAKESLALIQQVLQNEAGAARDIIALNAGAAIYVAGLADHLAKGIKKALAVLASGAAYEKFAAVRNLTKKFSFEA